MGYVGQWLVSTVAASDVIASSCADYSGAAAPRHIGCVVFFVLDDGGCREWSWISRLMLACDCVSREIYIVIHICWNFFCADIICVYLLLYCLQSFLAVFIPGIFPPLKLTIFPQTATTLCALNLFGWGSDLQIYHGNILLMGNKHRKLFINKQSKVCKFVPRMHQNALV